MQKIAAALLEAQKNMNHHAERSAIRELYRFVGKSGAQESRRPMIDRLMERIVFGVTECWHWTGATNDFGYGRMTSGGRLQVAHRLSWQAFKGQIPDGQYVLHKCDNPSCINPDHLWLGTYSDNLRDAWAKGRNRGNTKKVKQ